MGFLFSKPADPAPALFDKPWRNIDFQDKPAALQLINNYQPPDEHLRLRILLHGPVGAGKSSFINSVTSVLTGRMRSPAAAANMSESWTKELATYQIPRGDGFYPFVLNDTMGLQPRSQSSRRNHVKDMKRLLKGNIRDGYVFNPERKLSKDDRLYNGAPTLSDRVHVVVFVFDANTVQLIEGGVMETLQDVMKEAKDMGIPQVAILTKVDQVCPELKDERENVYRSIKLKQQMEQCSTDSGITMNHVFPVKNYHEETDLDNKTDVLVLHTLSHIIESGHDFLNKLLRDQAD